MAGVNRELRMVFTDVDIFVIVEKKAYTNTQTLPAIHRQSTFR